MATAVDEPTNGSGGFSLVRCNYQEERLSEHARKLEEHGEKMHTLEKKALRLLVASALMTSLAAGGGAYLGSLRSTASAPSATISNP